MLIFDSGCSDEYEIVKLLHVVTNIFVYAVGKMLDSMQCHGNLHSVNSKGFIWTASLTSHRIVCTLFHSVIDPIESFVFVSMQLPSRSSAVLVLLPFKILRILSIVTVWSRCYFGLVAVSVFSLSRFSCCLNFVAV